MLIKYDTPLIDYITLTSYNYDLLKEAIARMRMELGPVKESQIVMYRGDIMQFESGSLFAGTGQQGNREHYLVSIAGELADMLANGMMEHAHGKDGGNCSRIDLQITIKNVLDLEAIARTLQGKARSQITYITTLQGKRLGSTLYIGSPKSDKRIRIYHKEGTRFEVQYRRDYAYEAAAKIEAHGYNDRRIATAQMLLGQVRKLTPIAPIFGLYEEVLLQWCNCDYVPKSNGRYRGDTETWLRKSAIPCLIAECAVNPGLKAYVERLLKEATNGHKNIS